ncbi:hypothetical protein V3W47_15175 [Deinococcus sp. YIM 134068]|uniref:hypothetical protein n=1 Tax=Deinococcus lichenicola TaxID=3118910 RepID=UPI002F946F41
MPGPFRPLPLLAAVLSAALALTTPAGAAPARYAGVTWQDPPGMKVTDAYRYNCPGRCVVYEGDTGDVTDDFPLIRVHEALPAGGPGALASLTAWMEKGRGEVVRVLNSGSEKVGGVTVTLAVLSRADDAQDDDPDYSLFVLLDQGGVTLPLELYGFRQGDVSGPRLAVLTALADSVRLSPEAVRKDLTARTARFATLQRAIAEGYARGERARVFAYINTGVMAVPGGDLGLVMQTYQDVRLAAFLPGGVFLSADPEPDYRAPDLRRVGEGELPATWKAVSGGFQVTAPNGGVTVYRLSQNGPQATLTAGGTTYREAAPLKPADLVGIFGTVSTSSSSVGGTAVFSRSDRDLELRQGGRYLSANTSFTVVSGPNVGGGTNGDRQAGGRWSYDPASFTLTLRPDGGGVRSGPTYTLAYGAQRREKSVDWTLLGEHDWWKK